MLGAIRSMRTDRVLPFRFIAAARYAPQWEEALEEAMLKSLRERPKLRGKTVLLVDVSGSMNSALSRRSEMMRTDAAYGLAILLREIGQRVGLYTFSDILVQAPPRLGSRCATLWMAVSLTMQRIWAGDGGVGGKIRPPHCHHGRAGS